jgi:hypothetical protein
MQRMALSKRTLLVPPSSPPLLSRSSIFGVNADLEATCDELAAQGYFAASPDPFWCMEPASRRNISVLRAVRERLSSFRIASDRKEIWPPTTSMAAFSILHLIVRIAMALPNALVWATFEITR